MTEETLRETCGIKVKMFTVADLDHHEGTENSFSRGENRSMNL